MCGVWCAVCGVCGVSSRCTGGVTLEGGVCGVWCVLGVMCVVCGELCVW